MNKFKILAVLVVILMMAGTTYAMNQKNTGCGLGTIVFQGKEGLVSDTCAATTNGSFYSQVFGITSGTSNCEKAAKTASNAQLEKFVADNMDNLAKDIAQGNGEYLNTLATLMDVSDKSTFNTKLQSNFTKIFTTENISNVQIIENIENILNAS